MAVAAPKMGQAIGRAGDDGIDGIIKEDALGLDIVYVQAERYGAQNTVGRAEVQSFSGSLDGLERPRASLSRLLPSVKARGSSSSGSPSGSCWSTAPSSRG